MKESNKQFDDVKASLHTEALKLADELEALHQYVPSEAPAMIRRLVEELDKASVVIQDLMTAVTLLKDKVAITERDYNFMQDLALAYEKALENKKTKPLSDEEIMKEWEKTHRIGGVK